jgi:hypothetical protein
MKNFDRVSIPFTSVRFLNSRHQERSNQRKANKFKVLGAIKPKGLNRIAKKGIRAHMSEGVEP